MMQRMQKLREKLTWALMSIKIGYRDLKNAETSGEKA